MMFLLKSKNSQSNLQKIVSSLFLKTPTKYVIVGLIGAFLETIIFALMLHMRAGIVISNIVAFHFAFITCYYLHLFFTHHQPFRSKSAIANGLLKYTTLMYVQLLFGTALLWLMINNLAWNEYIAKVFQIVIVVPGSYLIQRKLVFKR